MGVLLSDFTQYESEHDGGLALCGVDAVVNLKQPTLGLKAHWMEAPVSQDVTSLTSLLPVSQETCKSFTALKTLSRHCGGRGLL